MKYTPLLMRGDMARYTLMDEKLETRRLNDLEVINRQPDAWRLASFGDQLTPGTGRRKDKPWYGADLYNIHAPELHACIKSPYGKLGDRIWIKETWRPHGWGEDKFFIQYRADDEILEDNSDFILDEWPHLEQSYIDWHEDTWIKVTDECIEKGVAKDADGDFHWEEGKCPISWRPSIFMPRWCSRITLEIREIRLERLWDLKEAGANAEGFLTVNSIHKLKNRGEELDPIRWYFGIWDEINIKTAPASSNPWLWVIRYKRIKRDER